MFSICFSGKRYVSCVPRVPRVPRVPCVLYLNTTCIICEFLNPKNTHIPFLTYYVDTQLLGIFSNNYCYTTILCNVTLLLPSNLCIIILLLLYYYYCIIMAVLPPLSARLAAAGGGRGPPPEDLNVKLSVKRGIEAKSYNDVSSCYVLRLTSYVLRLTSYVLRLTSYVLRLTS